MVFVTLRQWRTGFSLSRTIFVWEILCAGIPNHVFDVFLVSLFEKEEERKQPVLLSSLNLHKDAILADFFRSGCSLGGSSPLPLLRKSCVGPRSQRLRRSQQ